MRFVRTLPDVGQMRKEGLVNPGFLEYLEGYFLQLAESFGDGEPADRFSPADHGPIVILEPGNEVRDLSTVGLNATSGGLLGSWPEYVELVTLGTVVWYRIGILYDNEFLVTFYSEVG